MRYDGNMFTTSDGLKFFSPQRAAEHEETLQAHRAGARSDEQAKDVEFRWDFMHHPEHLAPDQPSWAMRALGALGNVARGGLLGWF